MVFIYKLGSNSASNLHESDISVCQGYVIISVEELDFCIRESPLDTTGFVQNALKRARFVGELTYLGEKYLPAVFTFIHTKLQCAAAVRALDRFHFDRISLGFKGSFIIGQIRAQSFQAGEVCISCHFA